MEEFADYILWLYQTEDIDRKTDETAEKVGRIKYFGSIDDMKEKYRIVEADASVACRIPEHIIVGGKKKGKPPGTADSIRSRYLPRRSSVSMSLCRFKGNHVLHRQGSNRMIKNIIREYLIKVRYNLSWNIICFILAACLLLAGKKQDG